MTSFALYRLPYEQQVTLVAQKEGRPIELQSLSQLDGQNGFVVAPFAVGGNCPLVIIRPDVVETYPDAPSAITSSSVRTHSCICPQAQTDGRQIPENVPTEGEQPSRRCYADDFERFHGQLLSGRFSKLVLSRCATIPFNGGLSMVGGKDPIEGEGCLSLFRRACQLYPRLFIALVSTPQSGTWLTATPEVLLESTAQGQWHTMALAGTMRLDEGQAKEPTKPAMADDYSAIAWSEKNIEEQRLVASYITSCLHRFSNNVVETGPRTVRAANLVHLRSDFTFTLLYNARVGELLEALHPTPAVCGLPKDEAFRFILDNEHTPRRYYSGFMGPLFNGRDTVHSQLSTHLFVSLRCMNITPACCHLYAGGGLLKSSTEEQEWQETEAKMETMRRCIFDQH